MTNPKNFMSRAEAQRLDALVNLSPKQWEKKVAGALNMNGWSWWRDRDKPRKFREANQFRKKGFPDYLAWKHFEGFPPDKLMKLTGCMQAGVTIFLFIEAKTGKGKPNEAQQKILEAAKRCPGMASMVAYPLDYDELIELLGGEKGL